MEGVELSTIQLSMLVLGLKLHVLSDQSTPGYLRSDNVGGKESFIFGFQRCPQMLFDKLEDFSRSVCGVLKVVASLTNVVTPNSAELGSSMPSGFS